MSRTIQSILSLTAALLLPCLAANAADADAELEAVRDKVAAMFDMIDRDELLIEFRQKLAELIEDIQACQRERHALPPLPAALAS